MRLTADELGEVVRELEPALVGSRVRTVHQHDARTLTLSCRSGEAPVTWLVSLDARRAAVLAVSSPPAPPREPTPAARRLRRELKGAAIRSVRQLGGDRVLEVVLTRSPGSTDRRLVAELFGRRPRLLLLDGAGGVLLEVGGAHGESEGAVWKPPAGPPAPTAGSRSPVSSEPVSSEPVSSEPVTAPTEPASADAGWSFPASRRLEQRIAEDAELESLDGRRRTARRLLARETRRRRKTLARIEDDLDAARGRERERELGELLKGSFGELRRGMESIRLVDYFAPDLSSVDVELDPALSPSENVERYFRRHRKAVRTLELLGARRDRLVAELRELETVDGRLRDLDLPGAEEDLSRLEAEVRRLVRRRDLARAGGRRDRAGPGGPRQFCSGDGTTILVGRSAAENDRLTFRIARGSDLFLHAVGRPGAHVIIRKGSGAGSGAGSGTGSVAPETLLDAANLALYHSLPRRSRGVVVEGACGEVDYTEVKHVRRAKGAPPGTVLLAARRTLFIRLERERLERLREGGGPAASPDGAPGV